MADRPGELPEDVVAAFDDAGVRAAMIGAHAVGRYVAPRVTFDVDVTVIADAKGIAALRGGLERAGMVAVRSSGEAQPSGPDFIRLRHPDSGLVLDIQVGKTTFERELVERAHAGMTQTLPPATPEDLVVLKLISFRLKDRQDVVELLGIPGLDREYLAKRAAEWHVEDRLDRLLRELRDSPG
ncbi:MAG: hypothetical protein Kow0010_05090 [Dehalococcoidia bacterium]